MDVLQLDSNSRVFHPGYNEAVDIDKDPSSGALKLTISHTINHYVIDDKTLAVLIMQVNPDDFIKPMLHTGGGLGQTGEALLVNSEAKILSTPKHPLADGTMAIPLEYQLKDEPAILASRGEEGIIATRDYRGKKVLAAYRHIRITSELE